MEQDAPPRDEPPAPTRGMVFRDLIMFQIKLGLDAGRDLVLAPISVLFALISLFASGPRARTAFYDLLAWLRRTDEWIDLFGAADRVHPRGSEEHGNARAGEVDRIATRVEGYVAERYHRRRSKPGSGRDADPGGGESGGGST